MSAPLKPWEVTGCNRSFQPGVTPNGSSLQSTAPNIGAPASATMQHPRQMTAVRNAPPLPPRPSQQVRSRHMYPTAGGAPYYAASYLPHGNTYGNYGNSYSPYSTYGGGYGGFGGYGINRYGGFPSANNPESRFIQIAEESSRPAFQSIESLVHAVGSVSFMLESTFNAMYSSFRAVLGVAENFGRLRTLFGQFFSVFAVFRTLQWLYRKCLFMLGLRRDDPGPGREALWSQAVAATTPGLDAGKPRSSWPILVFLGILFSGPYLMWKLLNSLNISTGDPFNPSDWSKSSDPIHSAIVQYDFLSASDQELTVSTGQKIAIAPQEYQSNGLKNWLLATIDGKRVGLVPANYVRIIGRAHISFKRPAVSAQPSMTQMVSNNAPEATNLVPEPVSLPVFETAKHIPEPPLVSQTLPSLDTVSVEVDKNVTADKSIQIAEKCIPE